MNTLRTYWFAAKKLGCSLLLVLACVPSIAATARFSNGAEATIPEIYVYKLEENGKTLLVHPKGSYRFEFRLTFRSVVPHLKGRPNLSEEFLIKQAKERKLDLVRIPGSERLAIFESMAPRVESDGTQTRSLSITMAIRTGVLNATFTVPTEYARDPVAKAFLEEHMEKILSSVQYAGG